MKTFYKRAVDEFLASPDGQECLDINTLGLGFDMRKQCMENRIKAAFEAGWNAGTESYERRISSGEITV